MEFVLKKLDEEQRDVQQRLQMVEGSFKALMDSARDVGELCRCGRADDPETATAARALEQGFARLAASQHVLQEYVRASQTVRGEIARFAAENGDVAEDAEGPQQQALEALLNRSSEQLARFSDAADAAKDADYDYKQHPLYAQFTASLSVGLLSFLSLLVASRVLLSMCAGKGKGSRGGRRYCGDAQQGERHLSHHPQAHRQACQEVCVSFRCLSNT